MKEEVIICKVARCSFFLMFLLGIYSSTYGQNSYVKLSSPLLDSLILEFHADMVSDGIQQVKYPHVVLVTITKISDTTCLTFDIEEYIYHIQYEGVIISYFEIEGVNCIIRSRFGCNLLSPPFEGLKSFYKDKLPHEYELEFEPPVYELIVVGGDTIKFQPDKLISRMDGPDRWKVTVYRGSVIEKKKVDTWGNIVK